MSTELIENEDGLYFTQFYGGIARGTCYQITVNSYDEHDYVQLTEKQLQRIVEVYYELRNPRPEV